MRASGPLRICVLGELRLFDADGRTAELPASKKTRALLGYLVATRRPHLRQRLCELFWDEGSDDPRAALRWSLTKLRPLLNQSSATRLVSDRNHVAFEACGAELDILTVRQMLAADLATAPLDSLKAAATTLCSGEFLDGLDLPACYRYQAWCLAEREALSTLRLSALRALVGRLHDQPAEALGYARTLVAADPLSIAGHCAVIRMLDSLGRRPEALEHYKHAVRVVEDDLGVPADQELHDAARAVRSGSSRRDHAALEPRACAAPVKGPSVKAKLAPACVGRSTELSLLERLVERLTRRQAHVALHVTGAPGIGKSHLLEQLRGRVAQIGGRTFWARAFEAERGRPYGIWSDLFGAHANAPNAKGLLDFTHALTPELAAAAQRPADRARLFARVLDALRQAAAGQLILVALDDIQWIDEGSAALFHYIARTCEASDAILLACSTRAGELEDNPSAANALASLRGEGRLVDAALAPLTREETAELIRTLDSRLDTARAFAVTDGNPLFVLELARAQSNEFSEAERTLHAVIARELARLTQETRELLNWCAALGRSFDVESLAALAGRPPAELLIALHELERRSVLQPTGENAYDFVHDIVRHAAYHGVSQPRRRLLHARIARHLGSLMEADDNLASAVAHHAALSSQHLLAGGACVSAGERCLRLFANADAKSFAERGLWHLEQCPAGPDVARHRIGLYKVQVLAAAVPAMRSPPCVADQVARAIAAAEAYGLHQAVMTGHYLLSVIYQEAGRVELAKESTLRAVRAGRAADDPARAHQLANTARCLLELETEVPRARALLREAETLAEPLGLELCEVRWGCGLMQRWDGEAELAAQSIGGAIELARRAADHWREYKCLTWLATIELERGRPAVARSHCAEMLQVARKLGDAEVPLAMTLDALAQLASGEEHDERKLASALQQLREIDDKSHLAYALNAAAALALEQRRVSAAQSYASEACSIAQTMQRMNDRVIAHATLLRLRGIAAQAGAQTSGADEWLDRVSFDPSALSRRARTALLEALRADGAA